MLGIGIYPPLSTPDPPTSHLRLGPWVSTGVEPVVLHCTGSSGGDVVCTLYRVPVAVMQSLPTIYSIAIYENVCCYVRFLDITNGNLKFALSFLRRVARCVFSLPVLEEN